MTEKEKPCGYCKHLQSDIFFGMWCDKGYNWKVIENCIDYEEDMRWL